MPKDQKARTSKARARMRDNPELTYQQALDQVDAEHAAQKRGIDPQFLYPYADEQGVKTEELGWRALPADATPAQKAHAEAVWRPVAPDRPCRCSGPCRHGQTCGCEWADGTCDAKLIHVDRYPGSMFSLIVWEDVYECPECGATAQGNVDLPDIPWGEHPDGNPHAMSLFSGVRHPGFRDPDAPEHPEGDGSCRNCGAYALSGFLCDGCRAAGWTDYYGMVEEPDPDDPRYLASIGACPECGAGGPGDPYGECDGCFLDDDPENAGPVHEEAY